MNKTEEYKIKYLTYFEAFINLGCIALGCYFFGINFNVWIVLGWLLFNYVVYGLIYLKHNGGH